MKLLHHNIIIRSSSHIFSAEKTPTTEAMAEYLEGKKKYEELKKQKRKKGSNREEQVIH